MAILDYIMLICFQLLFGNHPLAMQDDCRFKNSTTQKGEQIQYTVYYSVAGLYVYAGWAIFRNELEKLNGKPVYHIIGDGSSNESYDWIYKVRDRYETYMDTTSLRPFKFSRKVLEGDVIKSEQVKFDHVAGTATTDSGVYKVPACVQDVLTTVYASRNLDFSRYKQGDKIPYQLFLENEVHSLYIRYMGKEQVQTKYGRFRAIKFKPMLVEGTIFKGGEGMTVWVTDDANRLPIRIESQILIGSIKVDMTAYNNLRHPLTSLLKKKK